MFTTRKELWLNVQVAIFFGPNKKFGPINGNTRF